VLPLFFTSEQRFKFSIVEKKRIYQSLKHRPLPVGTGFHSLHKSSPPTFWILMTQSTSNVSTLGTHTRGLVTADKPLVFSNLLPNSAISVACDENTTALVEVSLSHSSLEPVFVRSALNGNGTVPASAHVIEEIRCKIAHVRVTALGTGNVTVETLQ